MESEGAYMRVLIVIPAYNEEKNIKRVVDKIVEDYPEYEYIVINDGSKDSTAEVCKDNGYNLIDLPVNLGLSGAFQTGLKYAYAKGFDCAVQFDADGQHRPEYINKMLSEIQHGYDIVIGSRFVEKKKPCSIRMIGSFLISLAMRITTGQRIKDPTAGMRMFNKAMIREFARNMNYGPEPDTVAYVIRRGARVKEVQVEMDDRIEGESYLNITTSMSYMIRMGISILVIQFFRRKNDIPKIEHNNGGLKI